MFDFGKRYHFAQGTRPNSWWTTCRWVVGSLSDGFAPEFDPVNKFINVTEVVSTPMMRHLAGHARLSLGRAASVSMRGMGAIFSIDHESGSDHGRGLGHEPEKLFLVSRNYYNLGIAALKLPLCYD